MSWHKNLENGRYAIAVCRYNKDEEKWLTVDHIPIELSRHVFSTIWGVAKVH